MIRELKLGDIPLLQLASGITASEPGLVSGQQVVSYVEGRLSMEWGHRFQRHHL